MFIKSSIYQYTIKFTSANKYAFQNNINKFKILLKNNKFTNYNYISLPEKKKKFFILRSPHVYKKSIETFEEQIYTSTFKIQITNSTTYLQMFYLLNFLKQNLPTSVNMTIILSYNV